VPETESEKKVRKALDAGNGNGYTGSGGGTQAVPPNESKKPNGFNAEKKVPKGA
jgi:hypothetical protein